MATPRPAYRIPNTWSDGRRYNDDDRRPDGRKLGRGFSYQQRGLAPFSGIDGLNALQDRSVPAYYNPTSRDPRSPVSQLVDAAQTRGDQINRDGSLTPRGTPAPASVSPAATNPFAPAFNTLAGITPFGVMPLPSMPAQPGAVQTPAATTSAPSMRNPSDMRSQINLSGQADAIRQNAVTRMHDERDQFRSQFNPTATGTSFTGPYGTGSSTTAPRTGPALFGPPPAAGQRDTRMTGPEFFQSNANRTGLPNKFSNPDQSVPGVRARVLQTNPYAARPAVSAPAQRRPLFG